MGWSFQPTEAVLLRPEHAGFIINSSKATAAAAAEAASTRPEPLANEQVRINRQEIDGGSTLLIVDLFSYGEGKP